MASKRQLALDGESLTYRPMSAQDVPGVSALVVRVFDEFVAPEYAPEGVQEIHRYAQPAALRARSQANHFALLALAHDTIVGVLEMRNHDHVSLMFVDPEFQRRGISRELLRQGLRICRANEPGVSEISVHSSPYAEPIYARLGFQRAGETQVSHGVTFIPMVLKL